MAYFSNGTEGEVFDEQCSKCKYGKDPCPIAWVQMQYNYKQLDSKIAREMLSELVKKDGTCVMFITFKRDLKTDAHQTKMDL